MFKEFKVPGVTVPDHLPEITDIFISNDKYSALCSLFSMKEVSENEIQRVVEFINQPERLSEMASKDEAIV